ncbi:uncharacterized protein LOC111363194 [Spodoptera litura]|uniref:Uncharacterized protein LOC111363194 n=1 Tax=Spodoptera litura TaxID=69820 RepID=A0A9J7EUR6_SPOLT|nr:uncharacterized protein LOC111363194 [Spodoptera litura]
MNIILCCAFILTIAAQCYGVSRIRVDHSNWTTRYGYEDLQGIIAKQDSDGTWKYQSLSNPDSVPQYSYSSRATKEEYDSATQRADYHPQQFEDKQTNIPVQPNQSNRPRPPTNNMDQTTEPNVPLQRPTNQQARPTNYMPRTTTYNYNQRTEPGVPLQRPVNQPNYRHNPTTEPTTHRVSKFPEQRGQRPLNGHTVVTMVDDNSNVLVYNSGGLPLYQSSKDNSYGSAYRPINQPRPAYQPGRLPEPNPTYRPNYHSPTYDGTNGGLYVSQSVNNGGPFPNYAHQSVNTGGPFPNYVHQSVNTGGPFPNYVQNYVKY